MSDYIKKAVATENKNYEEIAERLIENKEELFLALNQAVLAIQNLDHIVKKKCFYGKKPKHYEAPLFKGFNEDVLKDKTFIRLLHGFMGTATESGEGLEALAKMHSGEELDKVNVAEELGDLFWYSALIADETETTFEREMDRNIEKLAKRHGKTYNDKKVMDRDLDKERSILEKD